MRDDNSILTTLITWAVCYAESNINVVAEYIIFMSRAIHPGGVYLESGIKTVREIFTCARVRIACLLEPIPWLDPTWRYVSPVIICDHIVGFQLGRVVKLCIQCQLG